MDGKQFSKEPNKLLNKDPFSNEDTRRLFEAIDQLRSCGANHEIELPELVVVGDQSAGKSSLLQSLTDIPFPVDERLCTRFPTRIISRRTPDEIETTTISIEPIDPSSSNLPFGTIVLSPKDPPDRRAKRVKSYAKFAERYHSRSNINTDDFRAAVKDAGKLMGITGDEPSEEDMPGTSTCYFASDVLKVEISGPNRSYFSILDVPGVFQSNTKGITETEKLGVKNMVASYMMLKQSIIICVASGTNELANQGVFDMATEHDPQLQRTIGVITKCDVTQHKKQMLALAQGKEKHLGHGWFVVRNRTPEELEDNISNFERQKREEDFFNSKPWNALPESQRGTQALKHYLSNLLCDRIQEVFPSILAIIQERQANIRVDLEKLGPPRTTTEENRAYLTDLAQQLNGLTSEVLRGRYRGSTNKELRLRRLIYEANNTFTQNMIHDGHSVPFQAILDNSGDLSTEVVEHSVDGSTKGRGRETHASAGSSSNSSQFGFQDQTGSESKQGKNNVGTQAPCTKGTMFYPHGDWEGLDRTCRCLFQNICFMLQFRGFSTEELRLSDYLQETPSAGTVFGGFGFSKSNSQLPPTTSLFAANNSTSNRSIFQNSSSPGTGGDLFGSSSRPPPAMSVFGTKPTSNVNGGLFQQTAPVPQGDLSGTVGAATLDSSSSKIYIWIREEIKNCRGTELQGTLNPDVLPALFHRQIAGWEKKAMSHFESVAKVTMSTLEQAVSVTCGNGFTAQQILTLIRRTNETSEAYGSRHLQERFREIASRHLQTQNPIFEKNIRDARLTRFKAALKRYHESRATPSYGLFGKANTNDKPNEIVLNLLDVTSLFDELHISNTQNLEDEIHDTLKSYYELALHDFIEFVTQQVVESYLNDPKGPVLFFNPTYISSLASEEIDDIGAEDPQTAKERLEKEETLSRLERAEEIALKHR